MPVDRNGGRVRRAATWRFTSGGVHPTAGANPDLSRQCRERSLRQQAPPCSGTLQHRALRAQLNVAAARAGADERGASSLAVASRHSFPMEVAHERARASATSMTQKVICAVSVDSR